MRSWALRMLLVVAAIWHGVAVWNHYGVAQRDKTGRDFASYYYALKVAEDGGDPYDKRQLGQASRADETRGAVHPFFYPPPFLLTVTWAGPMDLSSAYRSWFWLDELFALLTVAALARWWRSFGEVGLAATVGTAALLTAIPNNHLMGQVNFPVLLAVIGGLWAAERGKPILAGALVGAACMMKMSPALFVVWWLLHRQWRPAFAACGWAVVYSLVTLPLLGLSQQVAFYAHVLPEFSSGSYNGLGVGIDLFGNHSIPNLYDGWFPNGQGPHLVLSSTARTLSSATLFGLSAFTFWALRGRPSDELAKAGHVGAIAAVMLLVPVITYEHHLIWLIPTAVAAIVGLYRGRLGTAWALPVAVALLAWCYDLVPLKAASLSLTDTAPWLAAALRESKMFAIVVMYAANLSLARSRA